jgi:hypothetical protein
MNIKLKFKAIFSRVDKANLHRVTDFLNQNQINELSIINQENHLPLDSSIC